MPNLQNIQDVLSEGDWCGFLPENSGNANIYQYVNLREKYKI